jgi:hypothetical protein
VTVTRWSHYVLVPRYVLKTVHHIGSNHLALPKGLNGHIGMTLMGMSIPATPVQTMGGRSETAVARPRGPLTPPMASSLGTVRS